MEEIQYTTWGKIMIFFFCFAILGCSIFVLIISINSENPETQSMEKATLVLSGFGIAISVIFCCLALCSLAKKCCEEAEKLDPV